MAEQKNSRGRASQKKSGIYIFWLIFLILVLCLFLLNWERIRNTVLNVGLLDRLSGSQTTAVSPEDTPEALNSPGETVMISPSEGPAPVPAAEPEVVPAADPLSTTPPPAAQQPAVQQPAARPAAGQVERSLYFMRIDRDGTIVRTKVSRSLPVTDSPMVDVLNLLMQGTTAAEEAQGLVSLIPTGTRVLSARIQGATAYISFNEPFQFNIYGVEGYIAQMRQIVWTATEFSTVTDVQILIEGRRVDYLGEGIWIGSPVGRDTF
jgi:spore germination protein GerM